MGAGRVADPRRIRGAAKLRAEELREALRFFDLVARTPALRARIAAVHASGAAPRLRAIAGFCGCHCSAAALQAAFRIDWKMRRRRYAGARALAGVTRAVSPRRNARARRRRLPS